MEKSLCTVINMDYFKSKFNRRKKIIKITIATPQLLTCYSSIEAANNESVRSGFSVPDIETAGS